MGGFQQEDLADAMVDMFEVDDLSDLDWLPQKLQTRRDKRKQEKIGKCSPRFYILDCLSCNQRGPRHI